MFYILRKTKIMLLGVIVRKIENNTEQHRYIKILDDFRCNCVILMVFSY